MAASAGDDWRGDDEFPACAFHLFHDSVYWGDQYVALKDVSYGMKFNETAQQIGFRDGDILQSADGKELVRFDMDMIRSIVEAREVTVMRQGVEMKILMPELSLLEVAQQDPMFVDYLYPNVVDLVLPGGLSVRLACRRVTFCWLLTERA